MFLSRFGFRWKYSGCLQSQHVQVRLYTIASKSTSPVRSSGWNVPRYIDFDTLLYTNPTSNKKFVRLAIFATASQFLFWLNLAHFAYTELRQDDGYDCILIKLNCLTTHSFFSPSKYIEKRHPKNFVSRLPWESCQWEAPSQH